MTPDGFVSSVGNPQLSAKYGNAGAAAAAAAAAPPPPPAPEVNPFTPEMEAALRTLQTLAAHLESVGVTPVRCPLLRMRLSAPTALSPLRAYVCFVPGRVCPFVFFFCCICICL